MSHAPRARMLIAATFAGLDVTEVAKHLVVDGAVAPLLELGRILLAPYVDNANVIASTLDECRAYVHALCGLFDCWNISYRIECDGATTWGTIGVILDAGRRLVYSKATRML